MISYNNIYNLPEYYDVAFSYDIKHEINIYRKIFNIHVPFEVKKILEPASGTGRFLTSFPKYGISITGYDISKPEVDFANAKIKELKLEGMAESIVGNMESIKFERIYDAAINSINSIGYILKDEDVLLHFINTSESIKRGGVYIIHLDFCPEKYPVVDSVNEWHCERDGISVNITWGLSHVDIKNKLSHQYCLLKVNDNGKHFEIKENHTLRLWFYEDLKEFIKKSHNLRIESVYNEKFEEIDRKGEITGEMGNLYFVLKVL